MKHTLHVKHLEESCRVLNNNIETMENSTEPDQGKLAKMYEHKEILDKELAKARKQQHANFKMDYVEFDDE
jgi:prefoldin subunit 5